MFKSSIFDQYVLTYYYSTFAVVSVDYIPTNSLEIYSAILILLFGAVLIGVVIAQFSNLLEILTSKQRLETEELDSLNSTMLLLRIKEKTQKKVSEFYEQINKSPYEYKKNAFYNLNNSLKK